MASPLIPCESDTNQTSRRPSDLALVLLGILLLLFGLSLVDAAWRSRAADRSASQALVKELGLSDLALFTEARYTRHPSQADRHAPFQDHPGALEHFPTGSLLAVPEKGAGDRKPYPIPDI